MLNLVALPQQQEHLLRKCQLTGIGTIQFLLVFLHLAVVWDGISVLKKKIKKYTSEVQCNQIWEVEHAMYSFPHALSRRGVEK